MLGDVITCATQMKGMWHVFVLALMSPYDGTRTAVRVDFRWSEAFEVNIDWYLGSVLSP